MAKHSRLIVPALLIAAALFFIFAHQRHIIDYDPPSFILGLKYGYNVWDTRPHSPGYPGFFLLWNAILAVSTLTPIQVILVCNIVFSIAGAAMTYWCARRLYDERTAIFATILVVTNPLFLFYGGTTYLYAYDTLFSAFLVLLLLAPPRRWELALYFLYGLLGGFRLSSVILTSPVVCGVLVTRYWKTRNVAELWKLGAVVIGTLAWSIPFAHEIGGWTRFPEFFEEIHQNTKSITVIQNLATFLPWTFWMFNFLLVAFLTRRNSFFTLLRQQRERVLFFLILAPASFFMFILYTKGYALVYLAPAAFLFTQWIVRTKNPLQTLSIAASANLLIFFALPTFTPPERTLFEHTHRSNAEHWRDAALHVTSYYAPSLSHLREGDELTDAEDSLVRLVPSGGFVMVATSGLSAYPRVLQAEFPELTFFTPARTDSLPFDRFQGKSAVRRAALSEVGQPLFYLSTSEIDDLTGPPPGIALQTARSFHLYAIPNDRRPEFIKLLLSK